MTSRTAASRGRAIAGRADVFSSLAVLCIVLAAVVSGMIFLVLTAYAPDLRRSADGGAHALSNSAVGYAGLRNLLRAEGVMTIVSRSQHPQHEGRQSLLIFTPPVGLNKPLKAQGEGGKGVVDLTLVVLPKWATTPDPDHADWVKKAGMTPQLLLTTSVLSPLTSDVWNAAQVSFLTRRKGASRPELVGGGAFFNEGTRIPLGSIENFQTFSKLPPGWSPALIDDQGHTVLAAQMAKNLYVLSDPDFLNTWGLAQRENAQAASSLLNALRNHQQPITFDVTLNGFARSRDILRLALEPPFLAATLCFVAAALLMGLHAVVRFGAPRPSSRAYAFGKQALAETSAGLIRMAGREPGMARRYAAVMRDLVARQVGAPRDLSSDQLSDVLDRIGRAKRTADPFSSLARQAQAVRDNAGLLQSVRNLNHWRREMTREHS